MENQSCYVCGKFFDDKVKLGLHLTPCYNEAVSVRKELWHPHPLDLVDEQRYTEYMRGRFREREDQIKDARAKNISFVTADTFEAMRGTLGPVRSKRTPSQERSTPQGSRPQSNQGPPPMSYQQPGSPSHGYSPSPPRPVSQPGVPPPPPVAVNRPVMLPATSGQDEMAQRAQIAQPVRQVATGVTMLRNELSSEIEKLRQLREIEEQNSAVRQAQFESLIHNFEVIKGAPVRAQPVAVPAPIYQQQVQSSAPLPAIPAQQAPYGVSNVALPVVTATSNDYGQYYQPQQAGSSFPADSGQQPYPQQQQQAIGEIMPDGRLRCATCGKMFGKKGFDVHAQRCFRGVDDFTFSKDARFEKNHPAPNQPVPQLQDARYAPQAPGLGAPNPDEAWTQFMTTYPRPILDEKPKTAKERNKAAMDAAKKAEFQQMVAREMSGAPPVEEQREPTVPCSKCGRYFYQSRVAKHEATCVSKPRR